MFSFAAPTHSDLSPFRSQVMESTDEFALTLTKILSGLDEDEKFLLLVKAFTFWRHTSTLDISDFANTHIVEKSLTEYVDKFARTVIALMDTHDNLDMKNAILRKALMFWRTTTIQDIKAIYDNTIFVRL